MRCPRCGNENPGDNRFCGMCGGPLLAPAPAAVAETQTQRAASAGPLPATPPVDPPRTEIPRPAARASADPPSITGPSFLGLNDPGPRKRASLSLDPHDGQHGSAADYLLDDEDVSHSGGAGKVLLILVLLCLASGFGYMTWKSRGLGWLHSSGNKPSAAATPSPEETASNAPATTPSITPEPQPPAAAAPTNTPAPATSDNAAASPPKSAIPEKNNKSDAPENASTDDKAAKGDDESESDKAEAEKPPAKEPSKARPEAKAPKTKPAPAKPAPKPTAAVASPSASDAVVQAQKYLYGKGASQDCDRGLRLLKPAANEGNTKAMIEMGALYSAGLCTPRDLPTSYRWFALALRKDPENSSVQADLQKLWGEMTQPERQLAIKLTQ